MPAKKSKETKLPVVKNFIYMLKVITRADPKRIWIEFFKQATDYGMRLFLSVVLLQHVLGKTSRVRFCVFMEFLKNSCFFDLKCLLSLLFVI